MKHYLGSGLCMNEENVESSLNNSALYFIVEVVVWQDMH